MDKKKTTTKQKENCSPCKCRSRGMDIAVKAIAILGITIGIIILKEQSDKEQKEIQGYEELQNFAKMDDVAHQRAINIRNTIVTEKTWYERLKIIDNAYHSAKLDTMYHDKNNKIAASEEVYDIIKTQYTMLQSTNQTNEEIEKSFKKIEDTIKQLESQYVLYK